MIVCYKNVLGKLINSMNPKFNDGLKLALTKGRFIYLNTLSWVGCKYLKPECSMQLVDCSISNPKHCQY